jgi:hypothetical protein
VRFLGHSCPCFNGIGVGIGIGIGIGIGNGNGNGKISVCNILVTKYCLFSWCCLVVNFFKELL